MQSSVRRWGNSAAIRLPAHVLEAARLKIDQAVDVREEDGRIVIEAVRDAGLTLDALVGAITDDNQHDELLAGSPAGKEAW